MSILSICFLTGLTTLHTLKMPLKVIFGYVLISFVTECIGFYLLHIIGKNSQYLYSYYRPVSFSILSIFFFYILNNQNIKKIIPLIAILVLLFSLYFIWIGKSFEFNSQFGLLSKLILAIYAIIYLRQILNFDNKIFSNPYFWTVTGILFFYSCFFLLSGLIYYISSKDDELAKRLYSINHILNIIYYSLVTYGFICQKRLTKSSL